MEAIIQIILYRLNVKPINTTEIMGLGISSYDLKAWGVTK